MQKKRFIQEIYIKEINEDKYMVKVSVVMPNYNGEKYIGEAIKSVLNQSFK